MFAPVAKLNSIRVLLKIAVNLDWSLQQLDVKNVFLNGQLEEEVSMDALPGFEVKYKSKICKLRISLYSLKQSPRAWFKRFTCFEQARACARTSKIHNVYLPIWIGKLEPFSTFIR